MPVKRPFTRIQLALFFWWGETIYYYVYRSERKYKERFVLILVYNRFLYLPSEGIEPAYFFSSAALGWLAIHSSIVHRARSEIIVMVKHLHCEPRATGYI